MAFFQSAVGVLQTLDALLRRGVKNSSVILDRLIENGYTGGKTSVKTYIREHHVGNVLAKQKLSVFGIKDLDES